MCKKKKKKKVGISFSSHLYQAETPWADSSSEVATSLNEIFHVEVCVCTHARARPCTHLCECTYVRMSTYVCVGGECGSGGRYFPITALPVSHCSGKLFATLHD